MARTRRSTDTPTARDRWRRRARGHASVVAYLALFLSLSGTAVAATGGSLVLGQSNSAGQVTTLTSASGPALSLRSPAGVAPLQVNRSVRVDLLNADLLDGRDSTGFARLGTTNSSGRTTLTNPSGAPLRLTPASGSAPLEVTSDVRVRNLNADLLDGRDANEFATTTALADLSARHQALQGRHDTLKAQHATLQQQFEALSTEQAGLVERVAALEALVAGVSRTTVNGYDTLTFSGVNVQVVNGSGSSTKANGLGNLLIGYSEGGSNVVRTGSHYVIVGGAHSWARTSGVVAGAGNRATGEGASVIGGTGNTAQGDYAAVLGGRSNRATGGHATVTGGQENTASGDPTAPFWSGDFTSVSGGLRNTATGLSSSISGGSDNSATGPFSSILGGHRTTTADLHECRPAC